MNCTNVIDFIPEQLNISLTTLSFSLCSLLLICLAPTACYIGVLGVILECSDMSIICLNAALHLL